jgi:hypothetical protein
MLIFLSIFLLSVNLSFAGGDNDKISKKDFWNALSGTWINTDYLGTWTFYEQKLIVYPDGKYLGKISDSGNTWEAISDGVNEPTEWDTSKTRYMGYHIRHRQE